MAVSLRRSLLPLFLAWASLGVALVSAQDEDNGEGVYCTQHYGVLWSLLLL